MVSDIPDQSIFIGQSFSAIPLDFYIEDTNNTDVEITWRTSGAGQLLVSNDNRVATITVPNSEWIGSETITFRATDPGGLWDEDAATFTVTENIRSIFLPMIIR